MRCSHGPYFTEVKGYPASPKTIGEMIRKRRLDLGLRQTDAARMIGCDTMTIVNWEKSHTAFPRINHMAGLVKFLGFKQLGVDPSTLAKWERGERKPLGRHLDLVIKTTALLNL